MEDGHADLEPATTDEEHLAGNHLVIQMENSNIAILLAHLKKGSILVAKGDILSKGQSVANVGNSGNSSEPHLHIHAVRLGTGDFLSTGEGVPITFQNKFLVRNDRVINPGGIHIRVNTH